jgi:hypothetical protein
MDINEIVMLTLTVPSILVILFMLIKIVPTLFYCQFYKAKKVIVLTV